MILCAKTTPQKRASDFRRKNLLHQIGMIFSCRYDEGVFIRSYTPKGPQLCSPLYIQEY